MRDFFKFEDENMDIPFYNGIPKLSKLDWLILIIAEILFITPIILPNSMDDVTFSFYLCLVVLIPVLYVSKGKLNLFFKKNKKKRCKINHNMCNCTIHLFNVYAVHYWNIQVSSTDKCRGIIIEHFNYRMYSRTVDRRGIIQDNPINSYNVSDLSFF